MNQGQHAVWLRSMMSPTTIGLALRHAQEIAEMIDSLPGAIFMDGTSALWRQVGIDAFFGYVRTLIEFLLVKRSKNDGDLTAQDVLGGSEWSPSYGDGRADSGSRTEAHLRTIWDLASKHQGHFAISRTALLPFGRSDLDEVADELLEVWDQFAVAAAHLFPDVPQREDFFRYR